MKKIWLVLLGILCLSALVGCQHSPYPSRGDPWQGDPYIGQSVQYAKEMARYSGRSFRVIRNNGQPLSATYDYRPGRINAIVENGVVVNYEVE